MADVGPLVAYATNDTTMSCGQVMADTVAARGWPHDEYRFYTRPTNNTVSGVLKELGVVKAGCKIRLYDEANGELLGTTTSAGDGTFSIPALGRSKVYVVAFDSPYNSLVFDNITPV